MKLHHTVVAAITGFLVCVAPAGTGEPEDLAGQDSARLRLRVETSNENGQWHLRFSGSVLNKPVEYSGILKAEDWEPALPQTGEGRSRPQSLFQSRQFMRVLDRRLFAGWTRCRLNFTVAVSALPDNADWYKKAGTYREQVLISGPCMVTFQLPGEKPLNYSEFLARAAEAGFDSKEVDSALSSSDARTKSKRTEVLERLPREWQAVARVSGRGLTTLPGQQDEVRLQDVEIVLQGPVRDLPDLIKQAEEEFGLLLDDIAEAFRAE